MHPAISLDRPSEAASVTIVRDLIGNATKETDLSITFKVDKTKLAGVTSLPFQVSNESSVSCNKTLIYILNRFKYVIDEKMDLNG